MIKYFFSLVLVLLLLAPVGWGASSAVVGKPVWFDQMFSPINEDEHLFLLFVVGEVPADVAESLKLGQAGAENTFRELGLRAEIIANSLKADYAQFEAFLKDMGIAPLENALFCWMTKGIFSLLHEDVLSRQVFYSSC